jgi:hypothetical protein
MSQVSPELDHCYFQYLSTRISGPVPSADRYLLPETCFLMFQTSYHAGLNHKHFEKVGRSSDGYSRS